MRALAFLLPLLTIATAAAADLSDLTYLEGSSAVTITDCKTTAGGALVIPPLINGKPVTGIGWEAFKYCFGLTSITVPASVTNIDYYAFLYCTGLTNITLPANLTNLGNSAFESCVSLTAITIPSGVTAIGNSVFKGCGELASVTLPPNLTSIGGSAFEGCIKLTTTSLPPSTMSIGAYAFLNCRGLTTITIPSNVSSIEGSTFQGCGSLTTISLPSALLSLGAQAFLGCSSLTAITIPSGVTTINDSTFSGCAALATASLPSGITSIGASAFSGCSSLTALSLPSSLTAIGNSAFLNCASLPAISLSSTITSIGEAAFGECKSFSTVSIPQNVTAIGTGVFKSCDSLQAITVHPSNTNYASVDGVLFNKSKTSLHACPAAITTVTIPSSVTNIEDRSFEGNKGLTRITIPASVVRIGTSAFANCPDLKTFLFMGNRPDVYSQAFTYSPTTTAYYLASRAGWRSDALSIYALPIGPLPITVSLSDVVTTTGADVAFEVTVDPGYPIPCRYKWRKNGVDLPGETLPVLSLDDIQPNDAGEYTVLVSSDVGTVSGHANLSLAAGNLYTQSQYDAGVTLGFQLGSQAGKGEVLSDPNAFDLYSSSQVQAIHIGAPLLQRNAATGQFELTIEMQKSVDLNHFSPMAFDLGDLTLSPEGKLVFRFGSSDNAAFFRVDAR